MINIKADKEFTKVCIGGNANDLYNELKSLLKSIYESEELLSIFVKAIDDVQEECE